MSASAIANLLGTVTIDNALRVSLDGGPATATTFIGPAADNTAAVPFTFTSDLNTGLASSAADTLDLVTGGTSRVKVSTTAVTSTLPILTVDGDFTTPALAAASNPDLGVSFVSNAVTFSINGSGFGLFDNGGLSLPSVGTLRWSSTTNPFGSADVTLSRLGAGSLGLDSTLARTGANGQAWTGFQQLTELTTIANAASTDTAIQMPAGAVVLGVSVRVTVAIPTATTFTVGDSGSAARFSTAAVSVNVNSTDAGTKAGAYYNASALSIRITPNGTPANNNGRVRVTIYFYTVTPPTS